MTIKDAFKNRKAFIAFLTCGDPDLETTAKIIKELEAGGADLIELGIPFSDPTAEGPVIQEANERALKGGVTTDKIFNMIFEPEAAALACERASDAEIREILALGEACQKLILKDPTGKKRIRSESAFHGAIIKAAHNDFISGFMPLLTETIEKTFALNYNLEAIAEDAYKDHILIMTHTRQELRLRLIRRDCFLSKRFLILKLFRQRFFQSFFLTSVTINRVEYSGIRCLTLQLDLLLQPDIAPARAHCSIFLHNELFRVKIVPKCFPHPVKIIRMHTDERVLKIFIYQVILRFLKLLSRVSDRVKTQHTEKLEIHVGKG